MTTKEIKNALRKLSGNTNFDLHCHQKSSTLFIIYGRVEGRPSPECEQFLANLQISTLGKYKVLSYSYDRENTCLCVNVDCSRRLMRSETPRTKLRRLSDCPALEQVPISSYEMMCVKYHKQGNATAALEIYDKAVASGLTPTTEMERVKAMLC